MLFSMAGNACTYTVIYHLVVENQPHGLLQPMFCGEECYEEETETPQPFEYAIEKKAEWTLQHSQGPHQFQFRGKWFQNMCLFTCMASDLRSVEESQPPYSYHPDNQLGEYPSPFSPFCPDSAPWKNMFTKLWNRSLGPSPTSTPGFRRGQVARWLSRNGCRSPWLTVRGTSHGIVSCSACVCVRACLCV